MIVCVCHRISDRDIAHAVREGCATFDALQEELGVATACGACHACACATFAAHAAGGHRAPVPMVAAPRHAIVHIDRQPRHGAGGAAAGQPA